MPLNGDPREGAVRRYSALAGAGAGLAVTLAAADAIIADRKAAAMVAAIWRRGVPDTRPCDARVIGQVGGRDLSHGFFSFAEVWTMAARDLVQTGRAELAISRLRAGLTVRQLLQQFYGIVSGPSWDDAAERRAFRRTLRRV